MTCALKMPVMFHALHGASEQQSMRSHKDFTWPRCLLQKVMEAVDAGEVYSVEASARISLINGPV